MGVNMSAIKLEKCQTSVWNAFKFKRLRIGHLPIQDKFDDLMF